jgi:hypothetical protein
VVEEALTLDQVDAGHLVGEGFEKGGPAIDRAVVDNDDPPEVGQVQLLSEGAEHEFEEPRGRIVDRYQSQSRLPVERHDRRGSDEAVTGPGDRLVD